MAIVYLDIDIKPNNERRFKSITLDDFSMNIGNGERKKILNEITNVNRESE